MDRVRLGNYTVDTLIALTDEEKSTGLMNIAFPTPVMSFPFDIPMYRKFWMKNTIAELDIVFCNGGKIISIEKGNPLSLDHIGPNKLSDLVVELPRGLSGRLGLRMGTPVKLIYSLESLARRFDNLLVRVSQ